MAIEWKTRGQLLAEVAELQFKLNNAGKLLDDWEAAHAKGLGLSVPEGVQKLREAMSDE